MAERFLDTNILLRHILNDDPVQSPACFRLIQAIEQRHLSAWTSDLVISEVVYILSNRRTLNVDRPTIRDILLPIIQLTNLRIAQKRMYTRVFELYTSLPIDYNDAYHAALIESRGETELYSYDRDFDRVPGLQRFEPSE
ncbi:MAG: type II toxin-antitoxin system VapC family toxin [Chloroflexi bacterium]|nr:type II toxin-antitoxin system VapC family toxin [Chloroflexota bacterium]